MIETIVLPSTVYRCNNISPKIKTPLFVVFIKMTQKLLTSKNEKDEKRKEGGRELFRAGFNIETNRNIKQWKRIENPDICAELSMKQLDTEGF